MLRTRSARILVVALTALTMVSSLVASAQELDPGGTFIDDDGNIHEGNIEAIAAEGVTRGCNPPDNTWFCPGEAVTRGQMAAFLTRALDLEPASDDRFADDEESIFEEDINTLAAAGITRGCNPPDNDEFCPDDFVTRGQMAAFLVRAFGYTDPGRGNLFQDDDNSIFEDDIDRLGTAGVTKGCNPPDNDWFCPSALVMRDQMASFLSRALDLTEQRPSPVMVVATYFFIDETVTATGRPFCGAVRTTSPGDRRNGRASARGATAGPTSDETNSIPGISTEVPAGVSLNSVTISHGVATVDVSSSFGADQPSAAGRNAQVVFTLRFPSVDEVVPPGRLSGAGQDRQRGDRSAGPSAATTTFDYQAAIAVETPAYGALVGDPCGSQAKPRLRGDLPVR